MLNWEEWKYQDWNDALVNAIFLDPTKRNLPIKRITASERMLAMLAHAPPEESRAVKRSFLHSFGNDPYSVRHRFEGMVGRGALDVTQMPWFFASLYATLLAGTADELTAHEGNFRERFAILFSHLGNAPRPNFGNLPMLWRQLKRWADHRAERLQDCRRLLLPDPGYETIIGYSKRLAFPGYRDESRLAHLLSQGASQRRSFGDVLAEVERHRGDFTGSFLEEFQTFRDLYYQGRYEDAADSPFWGAIQDLTWEHEERECRRYGRYNIALDISDMLAPKLALYSDPVGERRLARWFSPTAGQEIDGLLQQLPHDCNALTPTLLQKVCAAAEGFRRSAEGRSLSEGFLIFVTDNYGRLQTKPAYFDGARVCILVKRDRATRITLAARECKVAVRLTPEGTGWDGWAIVEFPRLDRQAVSRLSSATRDVVFAPFESVARSYSVHVRGGAWWGSSLVLNPATGVRFSGDGVQTGEFSFLDMDGHEVLSGPLAESDDKDWYIPADKCRVPLASDRLRVRLRRHDGSAVEKTLACISFAPVRFENPTEGHDRWAVDGPDGDLIPWQGADARDCTPTTGPASREWQSSPPLRPNLRFAFCPDEIAPSGAGFCTEDGAEFLCWLNDVLSCRYANARNLSTSVLLEHLLPVATINAGSPWPLLTLLCAGHWITRLSGAAYRQVAFARGARVLAVQGMLEGVRARLIGLVTRYERHLISQFLGDGESVRELTSPGHPASIGALEFHLSAGPRVAALAQLLGGVRIETDPAVAALAAPGDMRVQFDPTLPPLRQSAYEQWNSRKYRWEAAGGDEQPNPGDVFRSSDRRSCAYWVKSVGPGFWRTRSEWWALAISLDAQGQRFAELDRHGNLRFARRVSSPPPAFSAWWLLWGGGRVAIDHAGRLQFLGGEGCQMWAPLSAWLPEETQSATLHQKDSALSRHWLARDMRRLGKPAWLRRRQS